MHDPVLQWLERRTEAIANTPAELERLRDDLRTVVQVAPIDHEAAAVRVRTVAERLVQRVHRETLGDPGSKPLFDMIESLRERGKLPPRVASYLHTIRRIGDDAAHPGHLGASRDDLYAVILPLLLVVEWYFCAFDQGPRAQTIYRRDTTAETERPSSAPGAEAALEHAALIEELLALAEQHPDDFGIHLWIEADDPRAARQDAQRTVAPDPAVRVPRVQLGDRASICARADRECHLWIVDVGTTGRTAVLFPRVGDEDNRVKGNETVRISGTLAGKAGLETVHAFASTTRLPVHRKSFVAGPSLRDFLVEAVEVRQDHRRGSSAAATLQFAIAEAPEKSAP